MIRIKNMINKFLKVFLFFISLFGFFGCDNSNKNSSELTRYGVNVSNLSTGIVLKSKIEDENDLTSVRISTGNPVAYETYYFVCRFKVTSLEELKEDNNLFAQISFNNAAFTITKGKMIQTYSKGNTLNFDLFRRDEEVKNITSRIELPKEKGQVVNVSIAWEFVCDFSDVKYNFTLGSNQLNIEGDKLSVSDTLRTKKVTYKKPIISFDEELNSITWETVKNAHHYLIYIDGEELGCDPEREDSYQYIGKQNESGTEYLSLETLKSLGVSGKVKIKLKMEPHISDLANPVYSNTITVNVE